MPTSYTAAIVGCGSIAHAHMEGYKLVDNIDVVAVADPLPAARRQYMSEYGIPQEYATVEAMLDEAKPDIVSVCTWHMLHPAPTIAAARARVKGIICEKPMAIGMGAADSMIEACEASGTKLVISHQRRFTPGWERARAMMREGVIGTPIRVDCKVAEGLTNWGTHAIDGARFVLDDPEPVWVMGAVERRTDRFERNTPIEDACMGFVHMERDIQLFIQSDLMIEGADAGRFFIRGTSGMLDVGETYVRLFNEKSGGWQEIDLNLKDKDQAIGGNTNAAQVRELLRWIEGGPEHRGSGRKARVTVEIMMAMYESARQHRVIRLPMQEKGYPLELMIAEGKLPVEEPGRYDIRGFLNREGIDEEAYARMRADGMGHHQIMRILHQEAEAKG